MPFVIKHYLNKRNANATTITTTTAGGTMISLMSQASATSYSDFRLSVVGHGTPASRWGAQAKSAVAVRDRVKVAIAPRRDHQRVAGEPDGHGVIGAT